MSSHNDFGVWGENVARMFLETKGYKIIYKNYIYNKAEIDIIAQLNSIYIFVEVKTRKNKIGGFPEDAVSSKKEKLLAKAATNFIEQIDYHGEIRFDIISIIGDKNKYDLKHIEDAFFPQDF